MTKKKLCKYGRHKVDKVCENGMCETCHLISRVRLNHKPLKARRGII